MCKLFKPNSGAYKTHDTLQNNSQEYYKKMCGLSQNQTTRNIDKESKNYLLPGRQKSHHRGGKKGYNKA